MDLHNRVLKTMLEIVLKKKTEAKRSLVRNLIPCAV